MFTCDGWQVIRKQHSVIPYDSSNPQHVHTAAENSFSFAVMICLLLMHANILFNSVLLLHNSFLLYSVLSVLAVFGLNATIIILV